MEQWVAEPDVLLSKGEHALVMEHRTLIFQKRKQKPMVGQGVVDKPGTLINCKCQWVNKND